MRKHLQQPVNKIEPTKTERKTQTIQEFFYLKKNRLSWAHRDHRSKSMAVTLEIKAYAAIVFSAIEFVQYLFLW